MNDNRTDVSMADNEAEWAKATLHSISDAVIRADVQRRVTYLNPAAERLTGWLSADALGCDVYDVLRFRHEFTGEPVANPLLIAIEEGRRASLMPNSLLVRRDGSTTSVEDAASPILDPRGDVAGGVVIMRDITATRALNAKILHLAEYDALTDLPNRLLLNDRLSQAICFAARHQRQFAVLFVDLDGFKRVNDLHGHTVGDRLLQSIAHRLTNCVRQSDTVGRHGGDEFVIVLNEISHPMDAGSTADKIGTALSAPHHIDALSLSIAASIGIAVYPTDGETPEGILKHADLAMYLAKGAGRHGYQFFEPEMWAEALARQSLEQDLRIALQNNEFELHYQPKVDLASGQITGAEALLRWKHPSRGEVPTDKFIVIAEQSGLIVPIGRWVIREAARQIAAWEHAGIYLSQIAVNCSAAELNAGGLVDSVRLALGEHGIDAARLELEITETFLIPNLPATGEVLRELKELGVSLALDDFGTGYSSLSHLSRFPIDTLKIDRSFVAGLPDDDGCASIVKAVINMADSLNMRVVAEGIETRRQCSYLTRQLCREGQGYLMSKPLSATEFAQLLRGRK